MSSPEGKPPPIADNLSRSSKPSSTSVDTSTAGRLSQSSKLSSTSVDPLIADNLSRSSNIPSTSVDTSIADNLSRSSNIPSTSVDTSIADNLSRSSNIPSTSVELMVTDTDSDNGAETPRPRVVLPGIMDASPYPETGTPSPNQQALSSDTAAVTRRFHTAVKIESNDLEDGQVLESVEHDQEPEDLSSKMDWSNPEDEWENLGQLPAPPAQAMQLYRARYGGYRPVQTLVENAKTQVRRTMEEAIAADNAAQSLQVPVAMSHCMPLKNIMPMKSRPDIFMQYRVQGQTTTLHAGSVGKPKIPDHTFRLAIDAGKRGRPNLMIVLTISPDPAEAIETSSLRDKRRNKTLSLRFPTGNYNGKHSITNFVKAPATADIQEMAQATIQRGGPIVKTWTIKFTTDFCFGEGFEDVDSLSNQYSAELFEIIQAMQAIQSGAEVELSFMLKSGEAVVENYILSPFEHAVNTDLPQFFPYRHRANQRPIIDLNMELVSRVGEGMFQGKDKLSVTPWPAVDAFEDVDHYIITQAVGAVREHQYQVLDEHILSQQYHRLYLLKPTAIEGKKNKMYRAYIIINKDSDHVKLPVPAEGTNYRLEIRGSEDKPEKEWQGIVVQHSQEELHRDGCAFDFVIYVERPRGGRMPKNVYSSFRALALHYRHGYSEVRLHTSHADVVAQRPLSALRKLRDGQGPLRDAIIGRQRPGQDHRPIYEEEDAYGVKFLDTYKVLADHWSLNDGQRDAVDNALHNTLSLIQGPPGTGKTWTIGALIWLSVIAGNRVLACAVSNKAVDAIARRCISLMPREFYPHLSKIPMVRLHLPTSERQHVTEMGTRVEIANLIRTDEDLEAATQPASLDDLAKVYRAQSFKDEHWDMPEYSLAQAVVTLARIDERKYQGRSDPQDVCKDFRSILAKYDADEFVSKPDQVLFHVQYKTMVHRVFDLCHIVIATCNNSASADLVSAYRPDVIIIDEASQAAEIEIIIPIANNLEAKRVVLVGDHKQLAPVVPSEEQNEFSPQRYLALFERLLSVVYTSVLNVQLRATDDIMDFYGTNIYNGNLRTAANLPKHPTTALVQKWAERRYSIRGHEAIFIDVPNGVQEVEGAGMSMHNTAEALVVVRILHSLLIDNMDVNWDASLPRIEPKDVGVIVLYKAQRTRILVELQQYKAEHLNQVLVRDIETSTDISTVDSFQGSERDIMITSFVITSFMAKDGQAPSRFALNDRRLCVSMSRARYGLILVGNAEALNNAKARKVSDDTPAPKISLVAAYHENRGSLGYDYTKDQSDKGKQLLEARYADRQARQQAAGLATQARPIKSAGPRRELQEGSAQQYEFKHRQDRGNAKRIAEEKHQDDRGGKRPQQGFALNRGQGSFGGTSFAAQQGQGSFGGASAPGTIGTIGAMPPMRQPPPGLSPGSTELPLPPPGLSPGSTELPLPPSRPFLPLPPLPGTAGTVRAGAGNWNIRPAQTQQPARPPQQGPRFGGAAPPNQQTARGSTGQRPDQGSSGQASGGKKPKVKKPPKQS